MFRDGFHHAGPSHENSLEIVMANLTNASPGVTTSFVPPTTHRFVVATDGRPQSDAALRMARLLGNETRDVRLVAVLDTVNLVPDSQVLFSAELMAERQMLLQRDVEQQSERVWGAAQQAELLDGDPARCITQTAHHAGATLIIAGIGRHALADRLFSDETALRLIRMAETPVLAVSDNMRQVPRRIVAAIDFSETSIRATQLAVSLAAPGSTLNLVHIAPRDIDLFKWADRHKRHVLDELERVQARIATPPDMQVQTTLLQGDAATELLGLAKTLDADLIATGTHGHGFIARFLVGSVATRVVRGAACSVLVVPQAAAPANRAAVPLRAVAREQWASLLDDITQRNRGRITTLEVNDPLIGSQIQQSNHAFMGATWDTNDSSIALMFGGGRARTAHLTRHITGVTAVHVLQDKEGHDVALSVGHGLGQTIVTFRE